MRTDRGASADESPSITERLIDHVSEAAERIGEAGHAIVAGVQERVERVMWRFHHAEPSIIGQPIPADVRPVRPKKNSSIWLAWRED
jgi:hypothetical protein